MNSDVGIYLFEIFGCTKFDDVKKRLLNELKLACSEIHDDDFKCDSDVNHFAERLFSETYLNSDFWLQCKKHFIGNDDIINLINTGVEKNNLFRLEFLQSLYWQPGLDIPVPKGVNNLSEAMQNGIYGEEFLLQYLNENSENEYYVKSGKIVLKSVPCIGATPDYLKFYKSTYPKYYTSVYEFLEKAHGIVEVKTSLTPQDFVAESKGKCIYDDIKTLMKSAIKYRHIFVSEDRPNIYQPCKSGPKKGMSKIKWLSANLNRLLVNTFEKTSSVSFYNFSNNTFRTIRNCDSDKKVYVNFLTTPRGKQIIGQCLCFYDHHKDKSHIDCSTIYLYLSEKDHRSPEYYIRIDFAIPSEVLRSIEFQLNTTFYGQYISKCLDASK